MNSLLTKLMPVHAAISAELEQAGFRNEPAASLDAIARRCEERRCELAQLQRKIDQWQRRTFKNQSLASKFAHLRRELKEILDDPDDLLEWADVLNLFLGAAALHGLTVEQLIAAGHRKLQICEARKWGEPDHEGVYHHEE